MSNLLGYRAELANQVIVRLKRLSAAQWVRAVAILQDRRKYFDLAYRLSAHAIEIMVEEEGAESRALLQARLGDLDATFSEPEEDKATSRRRIARAAVLAVFRRDPRGFNLGAFQELYAPVAECVRLAEVEATANASISLQADDFKSAPQAPSADRGGDRRLRA
jgi:hypothetical protein